MKCQKIAIFKADAPSMGDVHFYWCRYKSVQALVSIKQMFGKPSMEVDNNVLPTSEAGPRARVCILYNRASMEAGHALPKNEVANQVIRDIFGSQKHTFHGDVAMFYINEAGSKVSAQILDVKDLKKTVAGMRKAFLAGQQATHAETFSDNAAAAEEAAAEEAAAAVSRD